MERVLIIEIKYSGMGDHLFHSHLPRIAKETKAYDKVLLSNKTRFGHNDYRTLIWEKNPYLDGFTDEHGITCDIAQVIDKLRIDSKTNLLDEIMIHYGLNNGKTWNQPEIYYSPVYKAEYNFVIFDPNFVSWVGNMVAEDAMWFFKKMNISFERVMKLRGNKVMYIPNKETEFIETIRLEDFCDLIFSAKKLYCLTSGTATLAAALSKPAFVFYGAQQLDGFKHYAKHEYILIPRPLVLRFKRKISKIFSTFVGSSEG